MGVCWVCVCVSIRERKYAKVCVSTGAYACVCVCVSVYMCVKWVSDGSSRQWLTASEWTDDVQR